MRAWDMGRIHFLRTTEHGEDERPRPGSLVASAVWSLAAVELLLMAFFRILRDEFPVWKLETNTFWGIQCFLVLTIVLFGIAAPMAGRFRVPLSAGLEAGCALMCGWYAAGNIKRLQGGLAAMFADYLVAWNDYYKTNYYVSDVRREEISAAFGFVVLLLLLLFLLLRYVAKLRWPLLLLPFSALFPGLMVDVLPEWQGLACYFVGAVLLYAGAGGRSRCHFAPVREKDNGDRPGSHMAASLAAVLAALLALGITEPAFGRFAERIPEKAPEFRAFQLEMEDQLKNIGNTLPSSNREYVDNSTPKYQDRLLLQISSDKKPDTNLYLADFYSGEYQNGKWVQSNREFRQAADELGVDPDRLGLLLRQMSYENGTGELQIQTENASYYALTETSQYRIDYEVSTNRALVPYFSDIAGLGDQAWVEDEGLVKKSRSVDSLEFAGGPANTDNLMYALNEDIMESVDSGLDWYSDYAWGHYVGESGIPAVWEQAQKIRELTGSPFSSIHRNPVRQENGEMGFETTAEKNYYAVQMATILRKQLADLADYNLYLDDIPAGTDTVQYFLETGHEGYCMHFASAGALILQELGVPARYASGYIVKRHAFVQGDSGEYVAPVYDRNAHAWVEIYLENFGWVPVDMTPGYQDPGKTLPTDSNNQESLQEKHAQKKAEEQASQTSPETETAGEPETETGTESKDAETQSGQKTPAGQQAQGGAGGPGTAAANGSGKRVLFAVLLLLAVLLTGFAVLLTGRWRYREALRREMQKKQYRQAVRRINRRICRRLQKGWFPAGKLHFGRRLTGKHALQWSSMTDAEYERRLVDAYPDITPEEWSRYMEVVKKAAFSREKITEEEMALCLRIYRGR
ncbi:MAG: transglutaminase-like domain-containing protein [Muribaculaceae bacterium]|nr:transglutaminase-like domain-containing protein [Roseburia sp.]MCM1432006.1 transglutaminase-like domain-containing protein [Muribaculaceae bacterium]MCM1493740.1 transglutaminase-like domain-containing protein [Muribaculaceae bacterium]